MFSIGIGAAETARLVVDGFAAFQRGDRDEAERAYRVVLAADAFQVDALMLLALLLSEGENQDEAETLLVRYDALVPGTAIAARHLGLIAQRRGEDEIAIRYLERAVGLQPDRVDAQYAIGVSWQRLGERDAARAAFTAALALEPAHAAAWHDLGASFEETDELAAAEAAYREAIAADPECTRAYGRLGSILDHLQRPEEATGFWAELARRVRFDTSPCTAEETEARILLVGGAAQCNIRPKFLFPQDRFETVQVDLLSAADADPEQAGLAARLGRFDLAFCLIADPDRGEPFLGEAARLLEAFDCPVLNPPDDRLDRTRRDRLPPLLDGIPGLIVPKTYRATRQELLDRGRSAAPFAQPQLVRPAGSHVGEALVRLERPDEIAPYLEDLPFEAFYVTDFHDYRSADGLYRKYRFIFVDRRIYPYHLAISPRWMLHYFRADTKDQAWMRDEEARFLAAPDAIFGDGLAAVEAVAERLDLDYAGIDCGIAADGQIVLFEANASMLAHLNDPPDIFPYKHRYVPRIFDAVRHMVEARLGRGSGSGSLDHPSPKRIDDSLNRHLPRVA